MRWQAEGHVFKPSEDKRVSHETIYAHIYAYPRGWLAHGTHQASAPVAQDPPPPSRARPRPARTVARHHADRRKAEGSRDAAPFPATGRVISSRANTTAPPSALWSNARRVILFSSGLTTRKPPRCIAAFVRKMKPVPKSLRKSLTYDRGREMALHKQIAVDLELTVYFADPHAPWQRGSNEHTQRPRQGVSSKRNRLVGLLASPPQ